ncbi:MAG: hypothetical protein FJX70_07440 [Alphaproteobacteria bacterium]|nr:hypothetical protein [Alphaproteobacteria bacterium]
MIIKKKIIDFFENSHDTVGLIALCIGLGSVGLFLIFNILHATYFSKQCSLGNEWSYIQWQCIKHEGDCNPERNVFKQYIYNDNFNKCVNKCEPDKRHDHHEYNYYWDNGKCHFLPRVTYQTELRNMIQQLSQKQQKEEQRLQEEFLKSNN